MAHGRTTSIAHKLRTPGPKRRAPATVCGTNWTMPARGGAPRVEASTNLTGTCVGSGQPVDPQTAANGGPGTPRRPPGPGVETAHPALTQHDDTRNELCC